MKTFPIHRLVALIAALMCCALATPSQAEKTRMLVHGLYAEDLKSAAAKHPDLELITASSSQEMVEKVPGCVAIVGIIPGYQLENIIKAGKDLKWIQSMSAGSETYMRSPSLLESDIVLTNAKIIQGVEIADHAMGLLLNFTRNLKFYNTQMESGTWASNPGNAQGNLPIIELRGKTALIIGLGGIGTQVAQRAAAFGMRVIATDPKDIPAHRDVAYVGVPSELDLLIPEADVIFSCVPHTKVSEGMLGSKQFALMKEGVYIINVSRGAIIDTDALVAALRSGKVRAAGLDVTRPEPLPSDHPLWSMANVTITPHIATRSDELQERRIALFSKNIDLFMKGLHLRNVVDKTKGY